MEPSPWDTIQEANFMEVIEMTTTMRRRVYVLQVGLIGILVFCAGFLFWGNSFIHNQISTELTNQQIFFPAAGSAALPAVEMADLQERHGAQRSFGSSASRKPSPTKLKQNSVVARNSAGKISIQGALSICAAPSLMSTPQLV